MLLAIACQCDDHGKTFTRRSTLCERCGIAKSGISRHLKNLSELGLIGLNEDGSIEALAPPEAFQYWNSEFQNRNSPVPILEPPPAPPYKDSATTSGTDTSPTPPWGEIPASLDEEPVRAALKKYDRHRHEKRSKMTPTAWRGLLKKLEAMGPEGATEALLHSIANGWTGVFSPNGNGHQPAGEGPYEVMDYGGNLRRVTAAQYRDLTGVDPPS